MTRPLIRRRKSDESGAVLVESAFVLPIVVLLVFSIIEFGLFFSTQATATSTTREGARFASANFGVTADKQVAADEIRDKVNERIDALTGLGQPVQLLIYKAQTDGESVGGLPNCTIDCYRYAWDGSDFVFASGSGWNVVDACSVDGDIDSIGVYIDVRHDLITGFFGDAASVQHQTALRLEPLPIAQC